MLEIDVSIQGIKPRAKVRLAEHTRRLTTNGAGEEFSMDRYHGAGEGLAGRHSASRTIALGSRPPTVPRGTQRLKLKLMANYTPEHLDRLIHSLDQLQAYSLLNGH